MRLTVSLIPDFQYATGVHEFPVDIEVSTDVPVEIYSRIDISSALLTKIDSPDVSFGYVQRVTPARRQVMTLLPEGPLRMRLNVFEHDYDFDDLLPGEYRCDVKVEIGTRDGEGFHSVELQDNLSIALPSC